ncbi:MAG: response regulator [Sphingomonadaceae bacterium]
MSKVLSGKRILVVEDSPAIAEVTLDMLDELGCGVVGPAGIMSTATEMAEQEEFDAALVDINIRGWKAFSVVEILQRRGIPFLLTSGYADWSMPAEFEDAPRLQKPYDTEKLGAALAPLLDGKTKAER